MKILEPIHQGDTDLLLIFCPGALQTSEGYFPLMREIQGQLSLRLWVVVFHCTRQEALNAQKIEGSIKGIRERLKEKGFRPGRIEIDNVFIGGHRYDYLTKVLLRSLHLCLSTWICEFRLRPNSSLSGLFVT